MAITVSSVTSDTSNTADYSFSHTGPASADTNQSIVFVIIRNADNGGRDTGVNGVTYNGISMTLLTSLNTYNTSITLENEVFVYYLVKPPSGSQTVAVDLVETTLDTSDCYVYHVTGANPVERSLTTSLNTAELTSTSSPSLSSVGASTGSFHTHGVVLAEDVNVSSDDATTLVLSGALGVQYTTGNDESLGWTLSGSATEVDVAVWKIYEAGTGPGGVAIITD